MIRGVCTGFMRGMRVRQTQALSLRTLRTTSAKRENAEATKWTSGPITHNKQFDIAGKKKHGVYAATSVALLGLLPAGILGPEVIQLPVDVSLSLLIPFHGHLGMVKVIEDYVPTVLRTPTMMTWYIVSLLTVVGLIKISVTDGGLCNNIKQLWRKPRAPLTQET
mmetsp:Transcript_13741/g.39084  ORF Transcript_13741/g.39084 Transcript_13741/m.39084 type:complete len:165 (-) Transcript_13741:49-543(-)|eukprot:CAMPEP_0119130990 /NCGR_PEP_ID=MMETSP1310-20130426/9154_1 /TAXON_ID=464262 /ORGANISM="Genus nov. species nov., Strain RCC2339" /LENGTH=164 /DNA_ID=CAMNT_0007121539 /DNA_START=144 /DNA_END=638 /DNA_ORIENTATION=-